MVFSTVYLILNSDLVVVTRDIKYFNIVVIELVPQVVV